MCPNKKFDFAQKGTWCRQKQVDYARKSVSFHADKNKVMLNKKNILGSKKLLIFPRTTAIDIRFFFIFSFVYQTRNYQNRIFPFFETGVTENMITQLLQEWKRFLLE